MRILAWHVHGSWMDAFVRGRHEYLLPTFRREDGEVDGARRKEWSAAVDVDLRSLRDEEFDVVLLQRLDELDLFESASGRRIGRDVPAIFVEHNMPRGDVPTTRHPLADRDDVTVVHVTHFNRLMWDTGRTPTTVIEHGIPDPGHHYRGDRPTAAVVINEPVRRWRITGTDLLPVFANRVPLELYGMVTEAVPKALPEIARRLTVHGDVKAPQLPGRLGHSRVYLHPNRWTSLGLSLLEAMHVGMPVAVLATAENPRAVPPEAGAISSSPEELAGAVARLVADPAEAWARGAVAREVALRRYGLGRFLRDWDTLLAEATRGGFPVTRHPEDPPWP